MMEERRLRVDSNPVGGLIEEFLAAAFRAHPYGQAGIGWVSDLQSFSPREDAETFFRTWYVPNNMTHRRRGRLQGRAEVMPILEKYFGRLPAAPSRVPLRTVEPPRRAKWWSPSPNPRAAHLRGGLPPSRRGLHGRRRLRRPGRRALHRPHVASLPQPGAGQEDRRLPAPSTGSREQVPEPDDLLRRAHARPHQRRGRSPPSAPRSSASRASRVTDDELRMVKTRAKRQPHPRGLDSNQEALAGQLATYEALYGDWRELFPQRGEDRQGHQGRYPARGARHPGPHQPHGGDDRQPGRQVRRDAMRHITPRRVLLTLLRRRRPCWVRGRPRAGRTSSTRRCLRSPSPSPRCTRSRTACGSS